MTEKYELETKNAVIEFAKIIVDDHGGLNAWLNLAYNEVACQAFGGFILYLPEGYNEHDRSRDPNYAGHFIYRVLRIAGVENWADLVGKSIRVKADFSAGVAEIGHIVNDDWFNPRKDFDRMKAEKNAKA